MGIPARAATEDPSLRISSGSTGFWKWVFAPFWTLLLGGFVAAGWLGMLEAPASEGALTLLTVIWLGLGSFFWWWAIRLEHVWLSGDDLVVRRQGREHRVPLADVREITETRWSRVKTVTVKLHPGHMLGDQILFLPTFTLLPFLSHPVVKDLYRRKVLAGSRYAAFPELF
jgi:hypothetical protein